MDSEKITLNEPFATKECERCFNRRLKHIFLLACGIIVIMVIIVLIVVLTKNKEKDNTPKDETKYELSMEELKRRTNPQYLGTKKLLKKDAKEYLELVEGDKLALKYLVKAGEILENIEYQIDDQYNIPFKKFLEV